MTCPISTLTKSQKKELVLVRSLSQHHSGFYHRLKQLKKKDGKY